MEEGDGSLGIVARTLDLDDFANAEAFVLDLLARLNAGRRCTARLACRADQRTVDTLETTWRDSVCL